MLITKKEIIIICWFAAQKTFLIIINVKNNFAGWYFCGNNVTFYFIMTFTIISPPWHVLLYAPQISKGRLIQFMHFKYMYIQTQNGSIWMTFPCQQDKSVAFKIFELGLKKYGDIPEYILAYIDYLSHLNGKNVIPSITTFGKFTMSF